ncbi:D-sedoheptulose 7-phosphate isomerase [Ideonella sp. DXS29W]|uniref:Phosphoheptose isomerase n=1 Tax=Ideonella lacteola TaxID=2984193 RepID=A0ABU9BND5_9BURK
MASLFLANLAEHLRTFERLPALDAEIARAGSLIAQSLAADGKLLSCGNGGSAADAQHIASELTGRFIKERRPLAAVSLTTDSSALTCIGNDYSFDEVFARQVRALGRQGDVLLAISTSGNSPNVRRAAEEAQALGMPVIGLLGRDGGAIKTLSDVALVVPSDVTARIQEAHILIIHTLCGLIEHELQLA